MNDLLIIFGVTLVGACAWLAWRLQRVRTQVRELETETKARAAELELTRLELQRLSNEDNLTALANHEQLLEFLEREWRRARRHGTPISLVLLDLDHFDAFNREFGRKAGDDCLRRVGHALRGIVGRAGDLVARYHRDEFAIVLASTDEDGAMNIGQRAREMVEQLEIAAAKEAPVPMLTASVAVASGVPTRHSSWQELDLIKAARRAMREARTGGGNRVQRGELDSTLQSAP